MLIEVFSTSTPAVAGFLLEGTAKASGKPFLVKIFTSEQIKELRERVEAKRIVVLEKFGRLWKLS